MLSWSPSPTRTSPYQQFWSDLLTRRQHIPSPSSRGLENGRSDMEACLRSLKVREMRTRSLLQGSSSIVVQGMAFIVLKESGSSWTLRGGPIAGLLRSIKVHDNPNNWCQSLVKHGSEGGFVQEKLKSAPQSKVLLDLPLVFCCGLANQEQQDEGGGREV